MRLLRITGVDLNIFEFDWDLTWAVLFLNADGYVYGRYGGRDAKGPDTRNSLAGLRFAMQGALEQHKQAKQKRPEPKPPVFAEKFNAARKVNGCMHCHQLKEVIREDQKNDGTWKRESVWVYPLPENIGITLNKDQGNLIDTAIPKSAAEKVGVKPGDVVVAINGRPVYSFADAAHALHHAPSEGEVTLRWKSGGQERTASLQLAAGWKKTNLTWRPSLLDILPSLTIFGYDLSAKEKKALGLSESRLAFRQIAPVHSEAQSMGVREGDIILGVDNLKLDMTVEQFLAFVRQNYLVGERVTLNLLRDGKRLDLAVKLR